MKTIVLNSKDHTRVPFLRGILTRSLLDAGLDFDSAFSLATTLRDELSDFDEVTSDEIRKRVSKLLEANGHLGVLEPYGLLVAAPARILVRCRDGSDAAFSRNRHERYLRATGMRPDKAEQTTNLIYDQLLAAGAESIGANGLAYLTWQCLRQEVSKKAARRYLLWSEFQRSERPLMLLICGAVGTGKSTVATEVAHVLDVVRIQSTDMLREVMRMMMPKKLLPVLHESSFDAWRALPIQDAKDREREQLVADGYRSQTDLLAVPCEAALQRAGEESVPLILEGVHAHPDLLDRMPEGASAIGVHVTLAVLKSKALKARLRGRGDEAPLRRARRYLDRFDDIWTLQSFLLSEADRCEVPIITNHDKEKAIQQVILQVNYELSRYFKGSPRDVYGVVVDRVREAGAEDSWQDAVPVLID